MSNDLLNQVLSHYSSDQQRLILDLVYKSGVEPDDPMFLALIILTSAQVAIAPTPDFLRQFHTELQSTLIELRASAQDYQTRTAALRGELEKLQNVIKVTAFVPRAGHAASPPSPVVVHSSTISPSERIATMFLGGVIGVVLTVLLAIFFQLSIRSSSTLPSHHSYKTTIVSSYME